MPYTPPAQQSPGNSKPPSPALSRSQSYLKGQPWSPKASSPTQRPNLPRSTSSSSYLSKHRRSPSLSKADDTSGSDPSSRSNDDLSDTKSHGRKRLDPHGSLHQSPLPANKKLIPTGAMMSPPESAHNSSDEEEHTRGRSRGLENLAELQAAIRIIEQRRSGSPNRTDDESKKTQMARDLMAPYPSKDSPEPHRSVETPPQQHVQDLLPLSRDARKISHSRSSTDSNIVLDLGHQKPSAPRFHQDSDDEDDMDSDESTRSKPAMVRKKSGELVRPALRGSSKRRPSSMPGTPTFSKAVHFDSHLEHVRHFLQVDKPAAVSAGSSPVEAYESEIEFPFGSDNARSRGPTFEWEIRLSNFPTATEDRHSKPVHVDRVFLSSDNKHLIGAVVVQNLAYQKHVTARFTLDYWKTTSEVVADFNNDVRKKLNHDGFDHFNFTITLADLANLENKTLFFCVRYNVNGQEYWDNNDSMNYQVDFTKKPKPQNGKNSGEESGGRPLNALPRSRPSPPMSAGTRPKSMASFDDFASGFDNNTTFDQSPLSMVGESPIRLKGPRPRAELVPDAPMRRNKPNSQAFGNRYDFGASLNAAIQSASTILGDQSGLSPRPKTKQSSRQVPASSSQPGSSHPKLQVTTKPQAAGLVSGTPALRPSSLDPSKILSEKPSLQSQSYQELVDKYCFFGSSKSPSPQLTKASLNMVDGSSDETSISDVSVGSVSSDGSSTPTPPRSASPTFPAYAKDTPGKSLTPDLSRSSSPVPKTGSALGTRTTSPVSFGFPYHQPHKNSFLSAESQTQTAILG